MRRLRAQVASFDRPARLLMVNQFAINLGFYMLMPYLADHLAHGLGLAAWRSASCSACATSPSRACSSSAARSPTGTAASR